MIFGDHCQDPTNNQNEGLAVPSRFYTAVLTELHPSMPLCLIISSSAMFIRMSGGTRDRHSHMRINVPFILPVKCDPEGMGPPQITH